MKAKVDYSLYLVTDRELMSCATIEESVEQAVLGGCTIVQLREKTADSREFYDIAVRVSQITSNLGVPLIINDRVDIALAVNADGVHVGQSDLPPEIVRRLIGQDKLLGVSASNLAEALAATKSGADYLGIGAMFATGTKTNANIVSINELHEIRRNVSLPLVAIGGINKETLPLFKDSGIDGIAVVSAVVSQEDIAGAARGLLGQWRDIMLGGRR